MNGRPDRSSQLPLSSRIPLTSAALRRNKKGSDSDEKLLSERCEKADNTSMPICLPEYPKDSNAVVSDDSEKSPQNRFVDLSSRKEVNVISHPHESPKVFQNYFKSVHRKANKSRASDGNTKYYKESPKKNYSVSQRASHSNVSAVRRSQPTIHKHRPVTGKESKTAKTIPDKEKGRKV